MTWITIFSAIMAVLGPFLADLLKKLMDKWFNKAQTNLAATDPNTLAPEEAVGQLFGEMEANLPRLAPARRLALKVMKRIAIKHAATIVKGEPVTLDAVDMEELNVVGKIK